MQERDYSIDAMRAVGLICVVLAHINPPMTLMQIRCFDVPLMLFVSGLVYSGRNPDFSGRYLLKRVLRLVLPTWLFLMFLFPACLLPAKLGIIPYFSWNEILSTFMLRDQPESIGYVWIIRIFIIISICTPFWLVLAKKLSKVWHYTILFISLIGIQELLINVLKGYDEIWIIKDWVLYVFGYSSAFVLGLNLKGASKKSNIEMLLFLAMVLCLVILYYHHETGFWFVPNNYKYPPHCYFLVWGAFMSVLLWTTKDVWSGLTNNRFLIWMGQNTIWIYLWHIPFLKPVVMLLSRVSWVIRYVLVFGLAILIFGIQYNLVKYILNKYPHKKLSLLSYLVG